MKGATLKRVIRKPLIAPISDADAERIDHDLDHVEVDGVAEGQVEAVQDQRAGDHAAQPDDRADRKVDAAGDDHEGHADGQERVDRHVLRDQYHVGGQRKFGAAARRRSAPRRAR